jgi:hypothetical protein
MVNGKSRQLRVVLLNLVAFAPGIVDPSQRNVPLPLTPLVTAHAVLSAAWLVLFLGQATSMATRRVALHRRVGTHQINGDVSDHRPWSGAPGEPTPPPSAFAGEPRDRLVVPCLSSCWATTSRIAFRPSWP